MKFYVILISGAVALAGCTSTTIEWGGKRAIRDADGKVLIDASGAPYYESDKNIYHTNRHWTDDVVQEVTVKAQTDGSYEASVGKYESTVAAESLVALVEKSLTGCADLAVKIGAAIATCGGSAAAEGGASAVAALAKQAYSTFVSGGGDAAKATVSTAADGAVTVSDGLKTIVCKDGQCSDCVDCK